MNRIHRSLIRRAKKINPDQMANRGEDYLEGFKLYRRDLKGIGGMSTELSIKNHIKKIDELEREIIKQEDKIGRLLERKAIEAAKLEAKLKNNLDIIKQYLEPMEYKDFLG